MVIELFARFGFVDLVFDMYEYMLNYIVILRFCLVVCVLFLNFAMQSESILIVDFIGGSGKWVCHILLFSSLAEPLKANST